MSKNIYEIIGFKKDSGFVFDPNIVDEGRTIFEAFPLQNIFIKTLGIEQTAFEEAFAISTAENSDLTKLQAQKIHLSEEQEARILKYKNNQQLSAVEKYDQLEFENIRVFENHLSSISFKDLNVELISHLHQELTVGLDDYCQAKGVTHYKSGVLRQSNSVKIGGRVRVYQPPDYKKLKALLPALFAHFALKKNIHLYDILEFHILFYAIHPFQNGNKRVVRILESMLLQHYGYSMNRTLSLAIYYGERRDDMSLFLMESLRRKNVSPFVNFAVRGYFKSAYTLFLMASNKYAHNFMSNFERYIAEHIRPLQLKNYQIACQVIGQMLIFSYSDFVAAMRRKKISRGISQSLIKDLLKRKIIQKKGDQYYFGQCYELHQTFEKLTAFLLRYDIDVQRV